MPEESNNIFSNFFKINIAGELVSSLIVILIIVILSLIVGIMAAKHDPLKKPKGLLLIAEMGVNFFDNFSRDLVGTALPNFGGFIMGVAMYLFISFIFGLTGLPSPVTYMAVPLSLGLTTFLLIHYTSARYTKWRYFKRYIDPIPIFLPINLISMWAPLLSLTLRLFGNAIAGWALLSIVEYALRDLSSTLFSFIQSEWNQVFLAPLPLAILHAYFDVFSGLIQTFVFILLTSIFIGQEIPEDITLNTMERRKN
ncbi:MAG: F0F1 ATP synthase subunit A [Bacilli bacterium]|nr:F0F1 ATP synthase subunit A [Bacilli bacterium]